MGKANVHNGKTAKRLLLAFCAASLVMIFALNPCTALAKDSYDEDALYEPEVVTIADDPSIPVTSEYVTYQKVVGNYKVLLRGVKDANKDALADAVLANLGKGLPVKFVNQSFVDADKYSTTCDKYDMYQCWLGSTSNVLTMTGWASQYVNPLTGARFANEDEVFSFMSSSFEDAQGLPSLAYSYFFDGLYGGTRNFYTRTEEGTALKPFAGVSHAGFDSQICSSAFVRRIECDGSASSLKALEGLQDHGLEMSISNATSHSVTIAGAVIDESKTGVERYVAILIADTDNEASTSSEAPASFEEANTARSQKCNSYTLYHLAKVKSESGKAIQVKNYLKCKPMTCLGSFTQVDDFSEAAREAAKETSGNATCDAKTTGDISLVSLDLYNQKYDSPEVYKLTDKLTLNAVIINTNASVEFNSETTGCDYLENAIEIYREGKLVGTVDKDVQMSLANGINCFSGEHLMVNLSKSGLLQKMGSYTLKFYLNTGGINEAYVMNNESPQSISFTIGKGDNPVKVKANKKSVKRSTKKARKARVIVKKAKGKVRFKTAKKYAKVRINSKGKITFAKGCKKGVYKFKVTAAGTKKYRSITKTVSIKVK